MLWCRSHLVWLVLEGSIPTCTCFHSENFVTCSCCFFFYLEIVREKRGGKEREGKDAWSVKYESIKLCCLGLDRLCSSPCLLFYSLIPKILTHYALQFTYYAFSIHLLCFSFRHRNFIYTTVENMNRQLKNELQDTYCKKDRNFNVIILLCNLN